MKRMGLKRLLEKRSGSLTVEAAMVFPLILIGVAICLFALGWLHDRTVLFAHVHSEQAELFYPKRGTSAENCTDQRIWGAVAQHCMLSWTFEEELTADRYKLKAFGPVMGSLRPIVETQTSRQGSSALELLRRVEQVRLWRELLIPAETD